LALKLMNSGYKNVYALKGGWNEWINAGYPVVPK
jgi:rhodanese-related sulfurtransferase